mgnify:CR=1 FL=1
MKIYFVILIMCLLAGCGEPEVEDYSAYNITIVISENWYEVDGKRGTDLLSLYYAKAATIAEKEKIQTVLSAGKKISYKRVKESMEALKKEGITKIGLEPRD